MDGNSWRMKQGSPSTRADGRRSRKEKKKKEKEKLDKRQALLIGNNAGVEGELTKQSFNLQPARLAPSLLA